MLFGTLGAEGVRRKAGEGDRDAQYSLGWRVMDDAHFMDDGSETTRAVGLTVCPYKTETPDGSTWVVVT